MFLQLEPHTRFRVSVEKVVYVVLLIVPDVYGHPCIPVNSALLSHLFSLLTRVV